jgi:hypothetical protein
VGYNPSEKLIVAEMFKNFLSLLWNPKVRKSPPLVSILSQMTPAHTLQSYFLKIPSNILSSTPKSSNRNFVIISLSNARYMPHTC